MSLIYSYPVTFSLFWNKTSQTLSTEYQKLETLSMMFHPVQNNNNCIKCADLEAVHLQLTHQTDNQLMSGKIMERRDEHSFKHKIIVNCC